jgi:tetratricopeptide (TPR) repeat protein
MAGSDQEAGWRMTKGQQLLEEGRFEDALACFSGNDLRSAFGRAVSLQMLGRFEESEQAYEVVLAADPSHEETLANLIALNVERFQLERVERYSRRLLEICPNAQVALRGLLVVAVERRDFDIAALLFAKLDLDDTACRDGVEYRLSRQVADRLKDHNGTVAHPY